VPDPDRGVGRGNAFWAGLALPGVAWLCLFFLLPFYVILCVAFGSVHPIFQTPRPEWNPLFWSTGAFEFVFEGLFSSGAGFQKVFLRTFAYVALATALPLLIPYPVAYFIARFGHVYEASPWVAEGAASTGSAVAALHSSIDRTVAARARQRATSWSSATTSPSSWFPRSGRSLASPRGVLGGGNGDPPWGPARPLAV